MITKEDRKPNNFAAKMKNRKQSVGEGDLKTRGACGSTLFKKSVRLGFLSQPAGVILYTEASKTLECGYHLVAGDNRCRRFRKPSLVETYVTIAGIYSFLLTSS